MSEDLKNKIMEFNKASDSINQIVNELKTDYNAHYTVSYYNGYVTVFKGLEPNNNVLKAFKGSDAVHRALPYFEGILDSVKSTMQDEELNTIEEIRAIKDELFSTVDGAHHMLDDADTYDANLECGYHYDIIRSAVQYKLCCHLLGEKPDKFILEAFLSSEKEIIIKSPEFLSHVKQRALEDPDFKNSFDPDLFEH